PTALSPDYVVDSDPEKDEKDPKEDPSDRETDESASTPSTILPPPLKNVKSLKDNIRFWHLES
nr:hypothetical protein [Tanacetum cinerariifolium]